MIQPTSAFAGRQNFSRLLFVGLLAMLILSNTGCMGFLAQMMYVIKGHKIPAEYTGLESKRVAVVCVSDWSSFGPDKLTSTVSKAVAMKLAKKVKGIEVVQAREIEDWIDRNSWDQSDFIELGQGVSADIVLAIEIGDYSIYEGPTLYKGNSELSVTAYNVKSGHVDHSFGPTPFVFPEHGRPRIQSNDRQFEAFYLAQMTEYIARQYYAHDRLETVAENARQLR